MIIYHGYQEGDSGPGQPPALQPAGCRCLSHWQACPQTLQHSCHLSQETELLSPSGFLFSPHVFRKLWWEQTTAFKGGPELPFCAASIPGTSSVFSEREKTWTEAGILRTLEARSSLMSHWHLCLLNMQTELLLLELPLNPALCRC